MQYKSKLDLSDLGKKPNKLDLFDLETNNGGLE